MKLLNLDSVKPASRAVTLGGKEYPIKGLTCGLFIAIKKLEDAEFGKPEDQINAYVEIVEMMVPTMPKKVVMGLDFEQIISLVGFITDSADEEAAEEAEAIEGKA